MTQMMDERNARIQRQHLERSAYVYVRQSSQRQYDLVGWASTAGWPAERIVVEFPGHPINVAVRTSPDFPTSH